MENEFLYNIIYLFTAAISGAMLFYSLNKADPEMDHKGVNSFYNNITFVLGIIIFISGLLIDDFHIQTMFVVCATSLIFFMFYSNIFVYILTEYFHRVDFRIYLLYAVFQLLLLFVFENIRGVPAYQSVSALTSYLFS